MIHRLYCKKDAVHLNSIIRPSHERQEILIGGIKHKATWIHKITSVLRRIINITHAILLTLRTLGFALLISEKNKNLWAESISGHSKKLEWLRLKKESKERVVDFVYLSNTSTQTVQKETATTDASATTDATPIHKSLVDQWLDAVRKKEAKVDPCALGLIFYADFRFNLNNSDVFRMKISDPIRWQLFHSTSTCKNIDGDVSLGVDFGFEHLNPSDIGMLYSIFNSYDKMNPSTLFGSHVATLKAYFIYLSLNKPNLAHQIVNALMEQEDLQLTETIILMQQKLSESANSDKVDEPAKPIQEVKAEKLLDAVSVEALAQTLPNAFVTTGTTATVRLYSSLAAKIYFHSVCMEEQERLDAFFDAEVIGLKLVEGMNGALHLIGVNDVKKIIIMSRLTSKPTLTLVNEETDQEIKLKLLTNYAIELVDWIIKLHAKTLCTLQISENATYRSLAQSNPYFRSILSFEKEIDRIKGNDEYKEKINSKFNEYTKASLSENLIYAAHCHNDLCVNNFYPLEKAVLDFNTFEKAPVAREIAALLTHAIFRTKTAGIMGEKITQNSLAKMCKALFDHYTSKMSSLDPSFVLDLRLFRLFIAQQLLKDTLFYSSTHSNSIDRFLLITELLDNNIDQTVDHCIDMLSTI